MSGLVNEKVKLISNVNVGPKLYLMRVEAPVIASKLLPGQFVHMRIPGMPDHILRRPFSVYAWDAESGIIDILYQTVGFGTDHLTTISPDGPYSGDIELIGPIGNVWGPANAELDINPHAALIVGGGAGAPAVFMLAKQLKESDCQVDVVLGAATKDALVCLHRYEDMLGARVLAATDDGTFGRAGFCTSLVEEQLQVGSVTNGAAYDYVATCGPNPLMKIVADLASDAGVYCEVSTERKMACGVGACLSCVVDTTEGKKRSCVDGPIFPAKKVIW